MLTVIFFFAQFSLADSLYLHQYYDVAQIEYKREFFFNPELRKNPNKRIKFALSVINDDRNKGLKELQSIIDDFPNLEPDLKVRIAKCHLQLGNYYRARELLTHTDEKNLLGFSYILDGKYISARDFFISIGNDEIADEISTYMNQPKKSMGTATLLSIVCPGAGEIYAGNIACGIRDFLLNFGTGYLIYTTIKQEKYVDAVLVFNFLFHRFYLGSLQNAQKSVDQANKRAQQKWLQEIKRQYFDEIDFNY